jgi:threonine synthase
MAPDWSLECSACAAERSADGLPTVCERCGMPWLVRYPSRIPTLLERAEIRRGHGMWRFRPFLPLAPGEEPISLGEGDTPLLRAGRTGERLGFADLWLKDEAVNPTGSFKARGLSAAVTRAVAAGAGSFVLPTAGNAGVAAAAYGPRAGVPVRV